MAVVAALTGLFGGRGGPASAHHLCGATGSPFGPFSMQTYEAADYRNAYARAMELAGHNVLFPEYGSFAVPALETGDRGAGSGTLTAGYVPPVLLKAIAFIESSWAQGSYDPVVQYGEVGPTLISHDCGYGLMQITSGMQNVSGVPNIDQAMIGGHYAFNIARGAHILADKWNQAPEFRPIVGNRDPRIIENWYFALWGYNGFAFKNHPLNPAYPMPRAPYSCGPENDGLGHYRPAYPYQELVLGCAAHPPVRGGQQLWAPQEVHLPDLSDPAYAGPLAVSNWEPCSFNVQCAAMDIPTPNPAHQDPTGASMTRAEALGAPTISVSGSSFGLVAAPGGQSQNLTVTVSNSGSGVLAWRLARNAPWLVLSKTQGVSLGSDLGGRSEVFTFRADTSSLYPGTHIAQIHVETLYGHGSPAVINVTLNSRDGALMSAPDGRVYVLQGGLKRYIPNTATFEAGRYSASEIVPVPADWIGGIPAGHDVPNVLANGRLVRPSGDQTPVYVMEGGAKRHIASADAFAACDYGWDSVAVISPNTLNSLASGAPLTSSPCPQPLFPNGTLLRDSGGTVWVSQWGARRRVASAGAFSDCGYRWGNLNDLGNGVLGPMPVGPDVPGCTADGSVVSTSDGRIHVMKGGLMRHVPDGATFEALHLSWAHATPIEWIAPAGSPMLSAIATGRLIQPAAGGPAPVYVMEGGQRRHIQSAEAFAVCGYSWDSITTLFSGTVDGIPPGPPVSGSPCPQFRPPHASLLRGPDGGVWVTTDGVRKWVPSPQVMADCGYQAGNINEVSAGLPSSLIAVDPVGRCRADGSIVLHGDGKAHLVRSGWKRHIPNGATFEAMGLSWTGSAPIADGWMPTGHQILDLTATGRLVRPPGEQRPVYVFDGATKRHVISPSVFAACGYGWDAVSVLSDATLEGFPTGSPLTATPCPKPTFANGVLMAGSDGKVWVIKNNRRHYVSSVEAFTSCGYRWPDLNLVADSIITGLSQGQDVVVGACQ